MSIIFRDCREGEVQLLQEMVDQLYEDDAWPSNTHAPNCAPDAALTFAELKNHPSKGRFVVFDSDGRLTGYAILIFFWSNEFRGDVIEIDELFVGREFRGAGIGKLFFAWLEREYAERCSGFSLQVAAQNEAAMSLYKRAGFDSSPNTHLIKLIADRENKVGTVKE